MSEQDRNDDDFEYTVVINHEEQYSIWPTFKEVPNGWKEVGKRGPKAECLAHIEEVWTDMRPLSLRRHMDQQAADQAAAKTEE
ncbi:MAG: MbtH family NRPS accessory protein [Myxococcota bacterium]